MNTRTSSLSSLSDLFRPNNPRRLRSRDLSSTRLNILKKEIQTDTHLITLSNLISVQHIMTYIFRIHKRDLKLLEELYSMLGTDPINGLTSDKAKELLEYYGPNTLTPSAHLKWPLLLFKSLCTGLRDF